MSDIGTTIRIMKFRPHERWLCLFCQTAFAAALMRKKKLATFFICEDCEHVERWRYNSEGDFK